MFTILKAIFAGLFSSVWGRLFPAKTASSEKVLELQGEVSSLRAEAKAAELAPTNMEALIAEQKKGDV